MEQARRRSTWKFTATVCALLVGLALLTWIWASRTADRRMAALEKKIAARITEIESRETRRPVLHGPTEPGRAWEDYRLALEEMRSLDREMLAALLNRNRNTDFDWGRRMLLEHHAALDHLRRGAGREASGRTYDWRGVGQPGFRPPARTPESLKLRNFSLFQARELMQHGNPVGAVDVYLDLCQYGRDVATEGDCGPLGLGIVGQAMHELHEALIGGALNSEALKELASGLAHLDEGFPDPAEERRRKALSWALDLRSEFDERSTGDRLVYLDCVERPWDWAERLAIAENSSWSDVCRVKEEIQEEARRGWSPAFRSGAAAFVTIGPIIRSQQCFLRLLLVAARWRTDGQILERKDPYGTLLKQTLKGNTLRIWSVGRDGVDDGGNGFWSESSKDIVLEVER